jgi:hypothetical protein
MDYPRYYLQEFKKYISLQTSSINTIKNYLSDLRLFFSFIVERQHQDLTPQSLSHFISPEFLGSYEEFLGQTTPPATAKRRLSSLKKFFDYCATQDIIPAPSITPTTPPPPPAFTPPDYSRISHPIPLENLVSPAPVATPVVSDTAPEPATSSSVQSLADLVPDVNPSVSSPLPQATTSFAPVILAFISFLIAFLVTCYLSLN